jgi:hypothetical protein
MDKKSCRKHLSDKIRLNIKENRPHKQAIAIAYRQTEKEFPGCEKVFGSMRRRSTRRRSMRNRRMRSKKTINDGGSDFFMFTETHLNTPHQQYQYSSTTKNNKKTVEAKYNAETGYKFKLRKDIDDKSKPRLTKYQENEDKRSDFDRIFYNKVFKKINDESLPFLALSQIEDEPFEVLY